MFDFIKVLRPLCFREDLSLQNYLKLRAKLHLGVYFSKSPTGTKKIIQSMPDNLSLPLQKDTCKNINLYQNHVNCVL